MADENSVAALLVYEPSVSPRLVADHIPASSGIVLEGAVEGLSTANDEIRASTADLLIVACQDGSREALDLIAWWKSARPDHPVVVMCTGSRNGYVEEAFGVGADDLVVMEPGPAVPEAASRHVAFALRKVVARTSTPHAGERRTEHGQLICILGPKGGIGKTITSCNLAVALTRRSKRVVLVDLDLQFGDVALSLGLSPSTTSYDLAVSPGSLDAGKLDAFLMTHQTGLRVLAAPTRPDQAATVTTAFLSNVFTLLQENFDYIIVDTPPAFSPEVISTIDVSSYVCMVGMLDALSLKNTRLGIETLELMGYESDRIRVVLNRANTNVGITRDDVLRIVGRAPDILVPSHRDVARSVNEGIPVVISQRRADAAKAFEALASLFAQAPASSPVPRSRGLSLMRKARD